MCTICHVYTVDSLLMDTANNYNMYQLVSIIQYIAAHDHEKLTTPKFQIRDRCEVVQFNAKRVQSNGQQWVWLATPSSLSWSSTNRMQAF